jgi:hypothetical protein
MFAGSRKVYLFYNLLSYFWKNVDAAVYLPVISLDGIDWP